MALAVYMCVVPLLSCFVGCRTRSDYRRWADLEVDEIVRQRECDPLWDIPNRPVVPDPRSRMADFNSPDCGALPPDDPAAHTYMHCADCKAGWPHWHCRGDLPTIEFPDWQNYLSTDEEGVLVLTQKNVMELALRHSRDYQLQYEQLYFSALALTLNRFEFAHQWFGSIDVGSDINGNGLPFGSETLSVVNGFGFTRDFTTGGQLLVNLANSFVWEFVGDDVSMASSGLLFSLTQPLLRNAFREIRMEPLTQAERNVLYTLRDFARFRREFYVDVVGANGFLGLLAVSQAIKNQRANLESLERSLEEHEQLLIGGVVSPIQVDQIFQQYQSGRLNLLAAEQSLEASLDQFKLQLGLPPQLEVRLDDDALSPFELSSSELDELTDENEALRLELLQYDEQPPDEFIEKGLEKVKSQIEGLEEIHDEIKSEWEEWGMQLEDRDEPADENEKETFEREKKLNTRLGEILDSVMEGLEEDKPRIETATKRLGSGYKKEKDDKDEYDFDDDEDEGDEESDEDFLNDDSDEEAGADDDSDLNEASDEDSDTDDGSGTRDGSASRSSRNGQSAKLSRAELIRRIKRRVEKRRNSKIGTVSFDGDILLIQDEVKSAEAVDSKLATPDRNEATFQLEEAGEKAVDATAEKTDVDDEAAKAREQLKKDLEELDRELAEMEAEEDEATEDSEYDFDTRDDDETDDDDDSAADANKYDNLLGEQGKDDEEDEEERERKALIEKETPWEALQDLVGNEFRKHVTELFVVQNQIRVFLIQVNDLEIDSDEAVARAMRDRLDLKNQRGVVVDTHRQVEVAADQLEADLDIQLEAELGTDPGRANPIRFDSSANSYRAGFEFDGPLNRFAERNQYRVAQINHQQARRDFMALKDNISAQIRADVRALRFDRFFFEITRQQLIVAARQVDEAQLNLRGGGEANSNLTRDLLSALQDLLDSKNNLIESWVDYETSRMNLFRDLEQMNISSEGIWVDEHNDSTTPATTFPQDQQISDGSNFDSQFDDREFDDAEFDAFNGSRFDSDDFQPARPSPSAASGSGTR